MAGVKRRVDVAEDRNGKRSKSQTSASVKKSKTAVPSKKTAAPFDKKGTKSGKFDKKASKKAAKEDSDDDEDDFDMDDLSSDDGADNDDEFEALNDDSEDEDMEDVNDEEEEEEEEEKASKNAKSSQTSTQKGSPQNGDETTKNNNSRESHIKQKALQQERKMAKPNADMIARSKKLWEQLRRKSHVPLEQRKKLIKELFEIVTGRVRDFVFKHDSVRVIQTALKYGNLEQRKQIAQELKGSYKELAQSRYAKFLVGKLIVHGDSETRDLIIPEFYGHVKRLIRHPEASWILDDIYRTVASKEQRRRILREWYGPEFAIFADEKETSELSQILEAHPEKRGPIMHFLHELINHMVQKKTTGFTLLHDAMLQYFLNTKPGSTEATEFIELLKGDE